MPGLPPYNMPKTLRTGSLMDTMTTVFPLMSCYIKQFWTLLVVQMLMICCDLDAQLSDTGTG